jgi:CRISPR/Cas system-associated exonuclease Cas4 (RecB family)
MKQIKLSPSSLNLFVECPRCFWLQINGISRPSGAFPSLPSGMDSILKKHFDKFMERNQLPPELKELKEYKLFNDKELLKIWRSNFKGLEYQDKGVLLHGAIDNLLIKGKKLVVLDYKTRGFPLKEDTHEHYIMQMSVYNFLLRKNGYQTVDYSYLLFYHPSHVLETGEVIFNTDLVKIKTSVKEGEKLFLKAVELINSECPEKTKGCEWCGWND